MDAVGEDMPGAGVEEEDRERWRARTRCGDPEEECAE